MSKASFPICQIMMMKGNTSNDRFGQGQLAHEVGHILLKFAGYGITADNWLRSSDWSFIQNVGEGVSAIKVGITNIKQDIQINSTNWYLRKGLALFGRDWVENYKNSTEIILGEPNVSQPRTPSILDLYRDGAREIARGAK